MIVYIDGFNLYYGLRQRKWRYFYWLNIRKFASNLLKPNQHLVAVHYFSARISARSDAMREKQKRQSNYFEVLGTLPETYLHFGHFLAKHRKCHRCDSVWPTYEEKMTDVKIAVQLLLDAEDDKFDTAIVVTADSDLTPPIDAVLKRFPNKRVIAAFPPKRLSNALKNSVSGWFSIDRRTLKNSQFPKRVQITDEFYIQRPDKWM